MLLLLLSLLEFDVSIFVGSTLWIGGVLEEEASGLTLCGNGSGSGGLDVLVGIFSVFVGAEIGCPNPILSINIIWSPSEIPLSIRVELFGLVIAVGGKFAFTVC